MDAISCKFSAQEADQGESGHAIERMDADLLIGPMEARIPAEEVRVFHLTESMFDVVLGSISADNLFISPFVIVGKEKGFSQDRFTQSSDGSLLDLKLERGKALGESGAGNNDLAHVFAAKDFLNFLLGALNRGLSALANLTACPSFQFCLQGMQFGLALKDVSSDALELSGKEVFIVGHQNRSFFGEYFAARSVGRNFFEAGATKLAIFV